MFPKPSDVNRLLADDHRICAREVFPATSHKHQRWHQGHCSAHQLSSFVGSDELSFVEDMPLYGLQELILAQARWGI
jgi:hypothetical protein